MGLTTLVSHTHLCGQLDAIPGSSYLFEDVSVGMGG